MSEANDKPSVVLWYRPNRRHKWRPIASGDWAPTVLKAMDDYHDGQWMLIDDGHDPNDKDTS